MNEKARKIVLPRLVVTEVAERSDPTSVCVELPGEHGIVSYNIRPRQAETEAAHLNGMSDGKGARFNLFPVVLDSTGVPWAEATVYLLSRIEGASNSLMRTYSGIADDLAAFRRFLDEEGIDWTVFPTKKLNKPTYRYNGYLKLAVAAGEIAHSTAKRRMSSIIGFYNWLKEEKALQPANPPWKERDRFVELTDARGIKFSKHVTTTDVSIKVPQQVDPYAGTIDDGGKLRPLPLEEQQWVLEALLAQENTEMTLIHLFGLLTGARIQTILTFRVRDALVEFDGPKLDEIRFPVGPGTGIDTKDDKRLVLHIPRWFYEMLRTYALSKRARKRRERARGGDSEDQYLFLSVKGAPLYQRKSDLAIFDEHNELRHAKVGQGVRQFMKERIIPYIRAHHSPTFTYRFHDTRASYGMNLTDHQLVLVARGETTLHAAREFVKIRMGHESSATTDLYLQYRSNLKLARQASQDYSAHLRALSSKAMEGLL